MSDAPAIAIQRAHDAPQTGIGARLLVDRLWPRGLTKAELHYDDWIKDVAPSTALRKWFGHDPARWQPFRTQYISELDANPDAVARCLAWCARGPVTLLFGAHDPEHNQAVVLRDYLLTKVAT